MNERNRLSNGRFWSELNDWTATSAVYSAGDGDDHYGVALLSDGGSIAQDFSVVESRLYTLHIAVKASAELAGSDVTATLTDADDRTLVTLNLSGDDSGWTENSNNLGLVTGSYTLTIANNSGADVKVDDLWLWFVPVTRATLAARVHAKLGRLATDRSLSATPSGSLTEGSYTYAVDMGLRQAGALNPETGEPDIRYVDDDAVSLVLGLVEREMLEQLRRDYAVEVDISVGPRRESLSQISKALGEMTGGAGAGGRSGESRQVVVRKLTREASDYEF